MKRNVDDSIFLNPITEQELLNTVNKCMGKLSTDCNDINMSTVKAVIEYVLRPLLHIFNLSFELGKFPDSMNIAKVIPVYQAGEKQCFSNYRPVSLLPQLSKILETLFNKKLMQSIHSKEVLYPGQYGFQDKMSTSLAIAELTEEITTAIDESKYTVGIFID